VSQVYNSRFLKSSDVGNLYDIFMELFMCWQISDIVILSTRIVNARWN